MNITDCGKIIESILFAAGYPVTYEKLSETLEIPIEQVRSVVEAQSAEYEGRGIQLIRFSDSCQLCTVEENEMWVKKALGLKSGGALSNSSLEVLSIIAYNQPVTRAFIEQVRGADSSYAIQTLSEKQLIECIGKLDVPGHPNLYATTDAFLRVFGLSDVSELPKAEVLAAAIGQNSESDMSLDEERAVLTSDPSGENLKNETPSETADNQ